MSVSIEQIILDVKRVCNKLKDREQLSDALIVETESVNKQVEAMKEVRGRFSSATTAYNFFYLFPVSR